MPLSRVRVVVPYVGGGYGGKLSVKAGPEAARDWMAAGGFAVMNANSQDELIADVKRFLEVGGDGTCEIIGLMTGPPPEAA